ncbi:MAG: electron transport complex subunit E [Lachnospiraceae bacterium]|nr:electron transport complex subunit E [Lachnospiraceae bacterium]
MKKLKADTPLERLWNGIFRENPTTVLMLGMCSTLAITTTVFNAIGMGLSATAVLVLSNVVISALRKIIPDTVRMPAYIVIVATLVTIVQFLVEGFVPALYDSLGIFIPLIVVNCIILGRAEAYANKHGVIASLFDGLGMGLGFTISLTLISAVREIIAQGKIFGIQILPLADPSTGKAGYTPISIFGLAPGAFFILAILIAVMKIVREKAAAKGKPLPPAQGCIYTGDCSGCALRASCHGMQPETLSLKTEKAEKAVKPVKAEAKAPAAAAENKEENK